jgi:hypothetical protein
VDSEFNNLAEVRAVQNTPLRESMILGPRHHLEFRTRCSRIGIVNVRPAISR